MYRKIVILIILVGSVILSGCKEKAEMIEPFIMTNEIIETMLGETVEGIYMISGEKDKFIIYRGVDRGIKTMTNSIENNVMEFLFETVEMNEPQDYVYKVLLDPSYDTISVLVDGEPEPFIRVFLQ